MRDEMREMSNLELAAMCTNLQKACTKQLRAEEAALFGQLASYYESKPTDAKASGLNDLLSLMEADLAQGYSQANMVATEQADRGALRALLWGEKVSKLLNALVLRYEKQQQGLLENTKVWVCEICGFIYVGDMPPEICPICKVPSFKIQNIAREAV